MDSFKNYVSEQEKVKNFVIKKDSDGTFRLMDSQGKEIKKSRKVKELNDLAKEKGYTVIYFNEDNNG